MKKDPGKEPGFFDVKLIRLRDLFGSINVGQAPPDNRQICHPELDSGSLLGLLRVVRFQIQFGMTTLFIPPHYELTHSPSASSINVGQALPDNTQICHPELDSGSSTRDVVVKKKYAWKIPNPVWNDKFILISPSPGLAAILSLQGEEVIK